MTTLKKQAARCMARAHGQFPEASSILERILKTAPGAR